VAIAIEYLPSATAHTRQSCAQFAFVREYLVDFNGTQAAIRAGFSVRVAGQTARDLLQHPHISPLLRRMARSRHDELELRADQTLERWRRIAGVGVASLFDRVTGERPAKPRGLPGVDRGSGGTLDRGVCVPPL
jgi:hypothetical protein